MDTTDNHSPALAVGDQPVRRYSYYALVILTLVNFLNYIDRQVLPAVAPAMTKELHLSDTEFGMMEASLLLSFTILAPLFGWLGDRYSRTKLMASAAVIWSIATGLAGWADKFPYLPGSHTLNLPLVNFSITLSGIAIVLCLVRAVVGVGESSYSTITPSLVADYFPPKKRATALGIFQAAIPMGFALGFVIGGLLATYFGWRLAFMIVGVPGLITAAVVAKLKEPKRGATEDVTVETKTAAEQTALKKDAAGAGRESWFATAFRILKTRDWLISTAGYTVLTFVLGAFATWAVQMMTREKGLSLEHANIAVGIATLLGGAAGTFGGGWIADRWARKRANAYYLICALGSLLGVVPTLIAIASGRPLIFIPAIFLAVMFLFSNNAPFHAILLGSVPPSIRATAVALNIVVIHLFGDVISRFGVGVLSDAVAQGKLGILASLGGLFGLDPATHHLTIALFVAPLALLLSALLFYLGALKRRGAPLETAH